MLSVFWEEGRCLGEPDWATEYPDGGVWATQYPAKVTLRDRKPLGNIDMQ